MLKSMEIQREGEREAHFPPSPLFALYPKDIFPRATSEVTVCNERPSATARTGQGRALWLGQTCENTLGVLPLEQVPNILFSLPLLLKLPVRLFCTDVVCKQQYIVLQLQPGSYRQTHRMLQLTSGTASKHKSKICKN